MMTEKKQVHGIWGWMLLIALGVYLLPFRMLIEIVGTHNSFMDGTWFYLTNPTSPKYASGYAAVAIFESIMNLLFFAMSLYLVWAMIKGKQTFPKLYILITLLNLIYHPLSAITASSVFPDYNFFDRDYNVQLVAMVATAGIWIPYMLKSVRVKNTFIYEGSNADAAKAIGIMFVLSCSVFGFTAYSANQSFTNQLQTEAELEQDRFWHTLQTNIEDLNSKLPMKVDKLTKLDAALLNDSMVTYRYTIIDASANEFDLDVFQQEMSKYLLSSTCKQDSTMQILSHDLTVKYAYYDEFGENIGNISINKADCTK